MKPTAKDQARILEARNRNELLFERFPAAVLSSLNKVAYICFKFGYSLKPSYTEMVLFCQENLNPTEKEVANFLVKTQLERSLLNQLKRVKKPKSFYLKTLEYN